MIHSRGCKWFFNHESCTTTKVALNFFPKEDLELLYEWDELVVDNS